MDELSTISYSPDDVTLVNNTASSDLPLSPTVLGDGEILSWAISPSLPAGLAFDTTNGEISGTPTEIFSRTMFTITGTNTGGTVSATSTSPFLTASPSSNTCQAMLNCSTTSVSWTSPRSPPVALCCSGRFPCLASRSTLTATPAESAEPDGDYQQNNLHHYGHQRQRICNGDTEHHGARHRLRHAQGPLYAVNGWSWTRLANLNHQRCSVRDSPELPEGLI